MSVRFRLPDFIKSMIRNAAFGDRELFHAYDQLFQNIESGNLIVRIPDFGGAFEIGATSHILRRVLVENNYEPELLDLIRKKIDPARDAIDVGANIGLLTVFMARLVSGTSRVLAIEPTPAAIRRLRGNITRNGCDDRVVVFEGVASHSAGSFLLNYVPGKEEYSSLGKIVHPSVAAETCCQLQVPADTIDSLTEKFGLNPGLIKIDTEGSEEHVLAGAANTMRKHRPVIVCESWPQELLAASGGIPGAVGAILRKHEYKLMTLDCPADSIVAIPNEQPS